MGYELSNIEWRLNPEQLNKKFLLFHDRQVLKRKLWKNPASSNNDIERAIKATAYQIVTIEFMRYFIKELHRIKTALANHKINDHPDKFGRYIYTNYSGLLKLHNPENTIKPRRIKFNAPRFILKYKKLTLSQINYDLQTQFVMPLRKTFEEDYQSDILPHPYVHAISKRPATQSKNITSGKKLQWKGPLNMLATIFYDMANTKMPDGEPYLNSTPNEIAEHIFNSYADKTDGNFSKESILTILRPGKADKRSPEHKKYKIQF